MEQKEILLSLKQQRFTFNNFINLINYLRNMKNVFMAGVFITLLFCGSPSLSWATSSHTVETVQQKQKIAGVVVDQNGEPIIGANILQKGTSNGTITDINGQFILNCPIGTPLTISYIGFLQQTVKATVNMKIVLHEDSKTLDEVVVVGYGYVKKSDLTGAVAQVKSGDLLKSSPVSLEKGLQGRLTGVNVVSNDGAPGGGISIQIRGTNSFQGSTEPLYVIDGVPIADSNDDTINFDSSSPTYNNALSSLNPSDIASIEILKDASSTAIYGSRGANGVVLITTKSGTGLDVKDQISFSYKTTMKAMNIEGLSSATLERFLELGYLDSFQDLYHLDQYREDITSLDGFGEKSYERLWSAITKSRETDFVHFLVAMDIPMVGRTKSRILNNVFSGSLNDFEAAAVGSYDFTALEDFGETLNHNIHTWFSNEENLSLWKELQKELTFKSKEEHIMKEVKENPFMGRTVVATGKLTNFTRDGINTKILELGGKPGSSVTKKTDYLICGEKAGSKLKKAQELNIPVLTEEQFLEMIA